MKVRGRIKAHAEEVTALSFSPDGGTLISGGRDATISWVDCATKKVVAKTPLGEFDSHPTSIAALTPDDVWLTQFPDPRARVRHVRKEGLVAVLGMSHLGFARVCVSRNGRVALSGGRKKGLVVWNVASQKPTGVLPGVRGAFDVAADGASVLSLGFTDHRLICWDVKSTRPRWTMTLQESGGLAWSPDGRRFAVASSEVTARQASSGSADWTNTQVQDADFLFWHLADRILAAHRTRLSVLRAKDGRVLEQLDLGTRPTALAVRHDGKAIAVGTKSGSVLLL